MEKSTTITKPMKASPQMQGWLGMAMLAVVIILLVGILALVIKAKPMGMVRSGMVVKLNRLEMKLEMERTLPNEQYQELKVYLYSLREFLTNNEVTRENLAKFQPVVKVYQQALQDGQIGRSEVAAIRSAVWQSNIPVDVSSIMPVKSNSKSSKSVK